MVCPVPPSPSSSEDVEENEPNATGDEGAAGGPQSSHHLGQVSSGRSSNDVLRRRLGPGFSLRPSATESSTDEVLTADDGSSLYRSFLAEEFRRQNLPEPAEILSFESSFYRQSEPTSSDLIRAGNQLRILSDEFAQSPMRQWVETQAAQVPLQELDFAAFSDLLYGLFQEGGVTWERVVVLFYFCSDLAIRAFREKLPQQFHNIVDWSFRYISGERMLRWVIDNGGWAQVLQKSVDNAYKIARIGFFVMGMLAFAAYLWKST